MRLDQIDQQIIALLQEDARSSYADIGSQVALSAPAVKRRVDRLRSNGVIRGYTALVDPDALGWTTEAFVAEVNAITTEEFEALYFRGAPPPKVEVGGNSHICSRQSHRRSMSARAAPRTSFFR